MTNISDKADIKKDDKRFTGPISMNTLVEYESQDFRVLYVRFFDGARTLVHHHTSDQTLIAQEGEGIVVFLEKNDSEYSQKENPIILKKGDTVIIPKGTHHYHGSNNKTVPFGHIAVLTKSAETVWDEKSYPI